MPSAGTESSQGAQYHLNLRPTPIADMCSRRLAKGRTWQIRRPIKQSDEERGAALYGVGCICLVRCFLS
jgi:hypothetical protein